MSWTEERIQELTRLWDMGHSASHIGKALGVSKNAVVGKAHRLKLASRPSPIKRGVVKQQPQQPLSTPKPAVEAPPRPVLRPAQRRANGPSCLWPIGDPSQEDFHFCGDPAVEGKPYCEVHCARAYITRTKGGSAEAA